MAHFAQLDQNNIVTQVIVVNNDVLLDENGIEQEQIGVDFCKSLFGAETNWKQTSYNSTFRKHFASTGYQYSPSFDVFIPPKPYDSWTLNEEDFLWEPPLPKPEPYYDAEKNRYHAYVWDEDTLSWILVTRRP